MYRKDCCKFIAFCIVNCFIFQRTMTVKCLKLKKKKYF